MSTPSPRDSKPTSDRLQSPMVTLPEATTIRSSSTVKSAGNEVGSPTNKRRPRKIATIALTLHSPLAQVHAKTWTSPSGYLTRQCLGKASLPCQSRSDRVRLRFTFLAPRHILNPFVGGSSHLPPHTHESQEVGRSTHNKSGITSGCYGLTSRSRKNRSHGVRQRSSTDV